MAVAVQHMINSSCAGVLFTRDPMSRQNVRIIDAMPADKRPNFSEAVYALNLSMRTNKGQVHSLSTLRSWLSAAGLEPGPHLEPTKSHSLVGAQLGFVPA